MQSPVRSGGKPSQAVMDTRRDRGGNHKNFFEGKDILGQVCNLEPDLAEAILKFLPTQPVSEDIHELGVRISLHPSSPALNSHPPCLMQEVAKDLQVTAERILALIKDKSYTSLYCVLAMVAQVGWRGLRERGIRCISRGVGGL